jgi:hypothetical protein
MVLDKLEILKDLFYGFGRDPHVNKGIFDHYLSKTSDTEPWILKKAVQELLAGCQSLPRVNDLLNSIKRFTPVAEHTTENCPKCGKDGLIYSIYCLKPDGTRMEVYNLDHKVITGAHYTTMIIGRCKCINGDQYAQTSHGSLSRAVEPLSYLLNSKWDSAFEASVIAKRLNKMANDFKPPTEKPMEKQLNKYDKS